MISNFKHSVRANIDENLNIGLLSSSGDLTNSERVFLKRVREAWDFYEGYHWEGQDDIDTPQVTFNYCRAFVNKFVSFELGEGFSIHFNNKMLENTPVTVGDPKIVEEPDLNSDGVVTDEELNTHPENIITREKTLSEFIGEVWDNNNKDTLIVEIGQNKSISGEAWIKVQFTEPADINDPFEEYPNGRIRLTCTPTQYVFPQYDDHDKDIMTSLLIMYPVKTEEETGILQKRTVEKTVLYKEVWTNDKITTYMGSKQLEEMENPYGFIPFVQIKNFPIAGRSRGLSDLEDLIPLNVEMNTKKSDVSEVIDYHSAPITLVYGAKIGNLEKGANKVWGGLPKDAKVENLHLQGDLTASSNYISNVKTAMCEIGGIPETVLGGATAVSNTSGVALQYINLPLIERTRIKRNCTKAGLQIVNKMIIYIALHHGLIEIPENCSKKDLLANTVVIKDTLPKDKLIELQMIQQELLLGLECRHGAMERLGKEDIKNKLNEIDRERAEHPEIFNSALQQFWYQNKMQSPTNAGGMMNSQTPKEQLEIEMTGQNGGATD